MHQSIILGIFNFLQLWVSERTFLWNYFHDNDIFFSDIYLNTHLRIILIRHLDIITTVH